MFLKEEVREGAETISYLRNGRDKRAMCCGIVNQGNLAGWIMIDPFVAKIVVVKLFT